MIIAALLIIAAAFADAVSKGIDKESGTVVITPDSTIGASSALSNAPSKIPEADKSGTDYPNRHLLSSGGGARSIGSYNLNLSVGQPVAGTGDIGPYSIESGGMEFPQSPPICGDADGSGFVDLDDIMYIVNYIFLGGPPSLPVAIMNANCYQEVDIDDVLYLVNYIFLGGNYPCDTDGDGSPDC